MEELKPPYIVIVDFNWEGHIPFYHKTFIKKFLGTGYTVVSISPASEELNDLYQKDGIDSLPSFKAYSSDIGFSRSKKNRPELLLIVISILKIVKYLDRRWFPKAKWIVKEVTTLLNWLKVDRFVDVLVSRNSIKPEIVFFGYMDSDFMFQGITDRIIDTFFKYRWSGVYLGPRDFRKSAPVRKKDWFYRWFPPYDLFKSKNCIAIFVADEGVVDSIFNYLSKPIFLLPEIMDKSLPFRESVLAREIKVRAKNRKIVSLLGVIAERKGVELLVNSSQILSSENVFFLFAGGLHDDKRKEFVLQKLLTLESNAFTYLEPIRGDDYFNELVELSDIVFLGYKEFYHGSGILTKAAYFEKPVIAVKGHCIGDRVDNYNLGVTIKEGNQEDCVSAIRLLTSNNFKIDKPNYYEYLSEHSDEALENNLEKLIALF